LIAMIGQQLLAAAKEHGQTGESARRFVYFKYRTRNTWTRLRRVVAKAEWIKPSDPELRTSSDLYESLYCARGEMENRIKECQLDLFSDRTSTHYISSNQLRLWFSALAYVLVDTLRRLALAGTRLATSTCGSIRSKLLKIASQVQISVRRIKFSMAEAFPHADVFAAAWASLS